MSGCFEKELLTVHVLMNVYFFYGRSPSSESPPKSPVRVSSRNEEQRYVPPPEANHVPTQGQNGDSDIHYVKATEVPSMPAESKHRDPIQVSTVLYRIRR